MLWRALNTVSNGFYIDLGAAHPEIDSVSNWFYLNSWRGIEVEPSEQYSKILEEKRPGNLVLKKLVGKDQTSVDFFELENSGLSTSNQTYIASLQKAGYSGAFKKAHKITLDEVFQFSHAKEVHWLKIDIEGSELDAILSWQHSKTRPWIVLVEATLPNTQIESHLQ